MVQKTGEEIVALLLDVFQRRDENGESVYSREDVLAALPYLLSLVPKGQKIPSVILPLVDEANRLFGFSEGSTSEDRTRQMSDFYSSSPNAQKLLSELEKSLATL